MEYHLIGVSGMHKGRLWPVDDQGLLMGRAQGCAIRLADPVVSRHQCRVVMQGDVACLEDVGGRNPVLVNGAPMKTATLKSGDLLALGHSTFLVAGMSSAGKSKFKTPIMDATAAWDKDSPVTLNIHQAKQQVDLRPSSLSDLVYLYDMTRELSRQSTRDAFLKTLEQQIRERFKPLHYRIAFPYGEDGIAFYGMKSKDSDEAGKIMAEIALECLRQGMGILHPGMIVRDGIRQRLFTLAAPLTAGEQFIGVVVLQTHTPLGAFDEDDLKLLVLLAASVAPILYTLEHMELLNRDNARLRAISGESETLIGRAAAMDLVRTLISHAAKSNLNVLITGETGTGKELAARMLHAQSMQHNKPFVVVNCAAIPRDLFESELFGYKKGAFTGASSDMPGLLSLAHGGILFLDEIGDLSLENQARILRVVEQATFRPVGGKEEIQLYIRIVAATNHNLEADIETGRFRADLFHRLSGFKIDMPALREHPEDIPTLVLHFIELARNWGKHPITGITPDAIELLRERHWPGNVRELRNCVLRAVALSKEETLQVRDFPDLPVQNGALQQEGVPPSLAEMEKRHIQAVIDQCRGNLKAAAEVLQIARSTLYKKISEFEIQ